MSLRVYLRFLRPLRSLVVVACFTFAVWAYSGQMVLHLDLLTAKFMALSVALPLLLGIFIAGAAHEPMHQPFALTLPNIRCRQRTSAAVSLLIAALAVMGTSRWITPTVAPLATFGLAGGLIALPCLDRRQYLAGTAASWAAFLICLLTCILVGAKLAVAMNAAPWLFLLAGLAFASACLAQGFSRSSLRIRANTLFQSHQTLLCSYSVFDLPMIASRQAEIRANRIRQNPNDQIQGRDWTVRTVGTTALDWIRVISHATFGSRKHSSFLGVQLHNAALTFGMIIGLSWAAHFFCGLEYWVFLAQLPELNPNLATSVATAGALTGAILIQPIMAKLCASQLLSLQIAYPISRDRLAHVVFVQTTTRWVAALLVPSAVIFIVSLLGQVVSGRFLSGLGAPALLSLNLFLAVLLPLVVTANTSRRAIYRFGAESLFIAAVVLSASSGNHWSNTLFTLPGILIVLVAVAASQWLLWHRLHRHFATTDLVFPHKFGNSA